MSNRFGRVGRKGLCRSSVVAYFDSKTPNERWRNDFEGRYLRRWCREAEHGVTLQAFDRMAACYTGAGRRDYAVFCHLHGLPGTYEQEQRRTA